MKVYEDEAVRELKADLEAEKIPPRLMRDAESIALEVMRNKDRDPIHFAGLKAFVRTSLMPLMNDEERVTVVLFHMSDREILEAIFRKLHR